MEPTKDNTSGTAEFDDFEDKDPDDCYCEHMYSAAFQPKTPDLKLLTNPETVKLLRNYIDPNSHYYVYTNRTREDEGKGDLPKEIEANMIYLAKTIERAPSYIVYKKYLDVMTKITGLPNDAAFYKVSINGRDLFIEVNNEHVSRPYGENIRLFHTSITGGITRLKAKFRSEVHDEDEGKPYVAVEALFTEPRVYFGYNSICSRSGGSHPISSIKDDASLKAAVGSNHLYEYIGPKNYIKSIYTDPELHGDAVYVVTNHDLPVREIKTYEDFKKGMISVNESYVPLSEFDHFFQEAKLKSKARNELDDSDFALVYKDASGNKIRKYPINDEAHVKAAARMFPRGVPNKYRKEVAGKILRRAHKFGIDTEGWKSLNNANKGE